MTQPESAGAPAPDAVPKPGESANRDTVHAPDTVPGAGESPSPADVPRVTIAVITWNGARFIDRCLDALASQRATDNRGRQIEPEIWVIDNASTDNTTALAAAHPLQPRLVCLDTNRGFAGAADFAIRHAQTPFVVVLNQDTAVAPGWLAALMRPFAEPSGERIAATTSKVVFADSGLLNNTGVLIGPDGYGRDRGFGEPDDGRYDTDRDVPAFSGTAAAIRVSAARAVGSFDPDFFLYYEDTELSWRLRRAGWAIRYVPEAVVRHEHAASTDPRSPMFAFYNERNRLWMLITCAPLWRAGWEFLRFLAITLLLPLRRFIGMSVPATPNFSVRLRLRVAAGVLTALPALLRKRWRIRALHPPGVPFTRS